MIDTAALRPASIMTSWAAVVTAEDAACADRSRALPLAANTRWSSGPPHLLTAMGRGGCSSRGSTGMPGMGTLQRWQRGSMSLPCMPGGPSMVARYMVGVNPFCTLWPPASSTSAVGD
jgi:hypothetical protein